MNDLTAPTAILARDLSIADVNPPLARLLGQSASRLRGGALVAAMDRAATPDVESAWRFETADGVSWRRLDVQPLGDGALATLVDVTAERAALERLRDAGRVRDGLMLDAEVGTWRYDPDAELYYFSSELALGHEKAGTPVDLATMALIQHREDAPRDAAIRQRLTTQGGEAHGEMRYRTGKGQWTHLRVHYRSGKRTASGRYEMYGISQNITEQAEARDAANAGAQRLKLALAAARAGVFEYDYKTGKFWVSAELEALVGAEALPGAFEKPLSLFHPDDRALAWKLRERAGLGVRGDCADVRLLRPDGDRWVRFYFEVEPDAAGLPMRGVGLIHDIDEQKRQELALDEARLAAEAATAAKSSFLASVSHEIRTPMNGIVGVLNLLQREGLSPERHALLGEALGCSEMLSQLINDVLDFSKIEAGKLELAPTPSDPALIAEGVANLLRSQATEKGLSLKVLAGPELGCMLIDPIRLRQCLFNIVGNAVKFTERGGVEVRLTARGQGPDRRLRCEVEDSGIGIPQSARAALFGRFQQADVGTTRRFGGTGLGLAISRSLARLMDGDMDFESREGRGSTFWFEIAAPASAAPRTARADPFADAPLAGLRVLVVDDNATNRLVGVKTLEALGAAAEAVDSGVAAVEAARQGGFDLVLMDINMPGMDGLEATRRIRALDGPVAGVPIIALTADVMTGQARTYMAAGMNGVAPKPFSPAQLVAEIARVAAAGDAAPETALSA